MESRCVISVALLFAGTFCIVATLGLVAFIVYLVFQHQTTPTPFRSVEDWAVPLLFLALITGTAMVVTAVVIGIRRPKAA
jgi:hypothetical protein